MDNTVIEGSSHVVKSKYPDAYCRKYAALSMVIWCPLLDCRLSGFFHTEEEAWNDAVNWIVKKLNSQSKTNNNEHKTN